MAELGLDSVDNVILSFPLCPAHELTLDKLQTLWEVLYTLRIVLQTFCLLLCVKAIESSAGQGKMSTVGVADLDKNLLEKLYDWATVS